MTLVTQHFDSLSTDMMRLNYMTHDISEKLAEQTRLLRMRNLGLPDALVQEAQDLTSQLDTLTNQMDDENTELAQLRALTHTAALINSTLELNEVLARAMDTVIGLTDAERGYILLRNDETGQMDFMIGRKIGREAIEDGELTISQGIVEQVIQTGIPVVTTNAQEDSQWRSQESVMSYALRSIVCVPLLRWGEVFGVVYADNRIKDVLFSDREAQLLLAFANQASIAIQNAQLFEDVRTRLAEVTEKQQLLDSIFASIASGVITTDRAGQVATYSPVAASILAGSYEESVGKTLLDVLPGIYEGFADLVRAVQHEGSQEMIDVNSVIPQRGPRNLSLKLSPLKDDTQQTLGVAVVVDDLTEIRQRDETLKVVHTYLPTQMVKNIESIDSLGLSGEEREITVISCDVRGFTTFSEHLPPEVVFEVINKYLTTSSEAIQLLEGIIDKYMGDAVLGLFNTQLNPHDNHAERAVRSALAMMKDVRALHEVLPKEHRLEYGIGVHTDLAVLGNVGSPSRKEFTILGDALTLAKKLQEVAAPGELIISEPTYQMVSHLFEAERTERQLRGDHKVVVCYQVLGLKKA